MKYFIAFFTLLSSTVLLAQKTELSGFIYDKNGKGIEDVIIYNGKFQEISLADGSWSH